MKQIDGLFPAARVAIETDCLKRAPFVGDRGESDAVAENRGR